MDGKVEFHCHTSNSFDCVVPLVERLYLYSELGFSHIAITDHDVVLNEKDFEKITQFKSDIEVIPAIEVSTHVGHIILLNCRRKPWINSLFFLVYWAKFFNAKIYVPHPCRKGTGLLIEYIRNRLPTWYIAWFLSHVKYVEVWNPRDKINEKVKVDASILEILKNSCWTVASDSHFDDDIHADGCPLGGLSSNDPFVIRFFEQKIESSEIRIPFTIYSTLRYIKSALRYAIG